MVVGRTNNKTEACRKLAYLRGRSDGGGGRGGGGNDDDGVAEEGDLWHYYYYRSDGVTANSMTRVQQTTQTCTAPLYDHLLQPYLITEPSFKLIFSSYLTPYMHLRFHIIACKSPSPLHKE